MDELDPWAEDDVDGESAFEEVDEEEEEEEEEESDVE